MNFKKIFKRNGEIHNNSPTQLAQTPTRQNNGTQLSDDDTLRYEFSEYSKVETAVNDLDQFEREATVKGKTDGRKGIPDANITKISATEKMFQKRFQEAIAYIAKLLGQEKARTEVRIEQLTAEIAAIDVTKTAVFYREEVAEQEKRELASIESDFDSKRQALTTEIEQKEHLLSACEADRSEYIKENGKVPTQKFWHKSPVYWSIIAVLGLFEFAVNTGATVDIGESSNVLSIIVALALSVSVAPCGHFLAVGVLEKNNAKKIASILGGIFILAMIMVLRHESGQMVILALMNPVIFIIGFLLAIERAKNRDFFLNQERITKLAKAIAKLEKQLKEAKSGYENTTADIEKKYHALATEKATKKIETQKNELQKMELHLSKIVAYGKNTESEIIAKFEGTLNVYRRNNTAKRMGEFPLVKLWEKEEIPNLERSFSKIIRQKSASVKAKKTKSVLTKLKNFASLNFTIALVVLLFGSCQADFSAPNTTTEVVVIADLTDSMTKNLDGASEYITKNILKMDKNGTITNGAKVTISSIQASSIQKTATVELPTAGNFLMRTERERKEETTIFLEKIPVLIQECIKNDKKQEDSEIMASLCQHLPALIKSDADEKIVLIFSDMLQNNETTSFYKYKKDVKALRKNYKNITKSLEMECEIGNLDGIEIRVIHLPDGETDRLFLESLRFWKTYLEAKGASVRHLPNL